jgi:signal transduction histidine kinase
MIRAPQTGPAGEYLAGPRPASVVDLIAASTAREALEAAVAWLGSAGIHAFGWLEDPVSSAGCRTETFVATGVDPDLLERAIADVARESGWRSAGAGRRRIHTRLVETLGSQVLLVSCGEAVVAVVDPLPEDGAAIEAATQSLELTLERIRAADVARMQSEGLHMGIALTAHELRGPLVGARAAIELALRTDDKGTARSLLERAHDELARMAENVDPLLRWAAGAEPLDLRRVELVRLVEEVVSSCRLELQTNDVEIFSDGELEVMADDRHLRSALANLIRNAVAYSPHGSPVAVTVHVAGDQARIEVHDRGPGIGREERAAIFDPFARGQVGRGSRTGRGLGLFISSRIVEAHGGSIWLSTDTSGSTFGIDLQLASPPMEEVGASAS